MILALRAGRGWTVLVRDALGLMRLVALAVLMGVAGLMAWALLPTVVGWTPHVVMSGSMVPAVQTGDVLLTAPLPATALRPGMIVVVRHPDQPDGMLSHRLLSVQPGGLLVTKGDANASPDTSRATVRDVVGAARLRVPFVGLLTAWLGHGELLKALSAAVLLSGAVVLAVVGRDRRAEAAPVAEPA